MVLSMRRGRGTASGLGYGDWEVVEHERRRTMLLACGFVAANLLVAIVAAEGPADHLDRYRLPRPTLFLAIVQAGALLFAAFGPRRLAARARTVVLVCAALTVLGSFRPAGGAGVWLLAVAAALLLNGAVAALLVEESPDRLTRTTAVALFVLSQVASVGSVVGLYRSDDAALRAAAAATAPVAADETAVGTVVRRDAAAGLKLVLPEGWRLGPPAAPVPLGMRPTFLAVADDGASLHVGTAFGSLACGFDVCLDAVLTRLRFDVGQDGVAEAGRSDVFVAGRLAGRRAQLRFRTGGQDAGRGWATVASDGVRSVLVLVRAPGDDHGRRRLAEVDAALRLL